MKTIILIIHFILMAQALADCRIDNVKVYGDSKIKDFVGKKMVSYYPELKDFKSNFPRSVFIKLKTTSKCIGYVAHASMYLSKGQRKFHYAHDHDHDKSKDQKAHSEQDKKEIIGATTINSEFIKKPFYKGSQSISSQEVVIKNIPHLTFYEQVDDKNWYDKVKYVITILDKSGKKVSSHTLILESPLIH